MTFGPNSNNPRERRSYAHALLIKAAASGETADYRLAYQAVHAAGNSRKSQVADFGSRLLKLAMQDEATRTTVEHGNRLLNLNLLGPDDLRDGDDPDHFVMLHYELELSGSRHTFTDVTFAFPEGSTQFTPCELGVTDMDKTRDVHATLREDIPVENAEVDATATRLLSDDVRGRVAALIERTTVHIEQRT